MFNIVTLPFFFLLITQANCFWNPFANFHPFQSLFAWFHRPWWHTDPFEPFKSFGDTGTSVVFEKGNTTVTATIAGEKRNATFPGAKMVATSTYIVNDNGMNTEKFVITVGNQTYIYRTDGEQTTVTDGHGKPVSGDPFNVITNNTDSTTNITIGTSA
ncbi:hypothetical protein GCK32_012198 [Trichostrongylus colubriformis]|uniref:Uncharacterized protein n=1 Tax=Trichostrongylus colubriformis TaxID=6319 RepID=A0AAN8FS04_TRICO